MASKNKDGSDKTMQQLLTEGLTDFIGFAGGAFFVLLDRYIFGI